MHTSEKVEIAISAGIAAIGIVTLLGTHIQERFNLAGAEQKIGPEISAFANDAVEKIQKQPDMVPASKTIQSGDYNFTVKYNQIVEDKHVTNELTDEVFRCKRVSVNSTASTWIAARTHETWSKPFDCKRAPA